MNDLISNDRVIQHLLKWAEQRESVRAVLLTSTRTMPGASLDPFSDYDVILAVTDIHPFFEDRGWLGDFGPVLVVYRDPIRVEHGCERFAYITQYETDRLKIDFTVMQAEWLHHTAGSPSLPDELDVGYWVLLDKDNLTDGLQPPTYTAYIPTPPTEEAYLELIEVFFHDATYAAKHLWRGDLLPAKQSIDCVLKFKKIRQLLEWQMGFDTGWSIKAGAYGKGLKKYVHPEIWAALGKTYVGAGSEENWNALFETVELFRHVAITVGEHLGYAYPHDMDRRIMVYLHEVKALARD